MSVNRFSLVARIIVMCILSGTMTLLAWWGLFGPFAAMFLGVFGTFVSIVEDIQ